MLRLERPAVHRIDQQHLGTHRVGDRQRAFVVMLDAALDAAVGPSEHQFDRVRPYAGLVEDPGKRRPRPFRRADRLEEPRLASHAVRHARTTVAGAFERHRHGARRPRSDVVH
jgi:hypothetical protein